MTTAHDRMNDNEYTIKGLTPGKEYEFRVAAANRAGVGKFSTTDAPIEARPPDCPPKAYGFVNGHKEMTVKAGETLRIVVPYQGSPKPTTNWSKVGEEILKEDSRTKFEVSPTEAALVAPNATLKDSGTYNCTLRNDFGSERVTIKVTVIDKPGQPQGPLEVSNIKADGCTLSWKPPKVTQIIIIQNPSVVSFSGLFHKRRTAEPRSPTMWLKNTTPRKKSGKRLVLSAKYRFMT